MHSAEHTYLINAGGSNSFITTKCSYCYPSLPSQICILRPQRRLGQDRVASTGTGELIQGS